MTSGSTSFNEEELFDCFDECDSNDLGSAFGDCEDQNDFRNDDDEESYGFTVGETIANCLVIWAVKFGISHTALSALLLMLRRFGHLELPKSARTLLRTPRKAVSPRPCGSDQFFYRAIEYYMDQYDGTFLRRNDTVIVDFFIDGVSVSDSSKVKLWPIMGSFVNEPTIEPFVCGLYAEDSDPEDPDDYMREFVEEVKHLTENGITVTKDRVLKNFRFRCFVGDAPALSLARGTLGHASYYGCPKYDQVCCNDGHRMYYQFYVGELRTDESFRERTDIFHHKPEFQNKHLLLEDVIGMVSQSLIEAMHGLDLGVTKRVVKAIFNNETPSSKISKAELAALYARFKSFSDYVPSDFARKPRSLYGLSSFKATEFRQIMLYTLPVLLKNTIDPEQYNHILKLHVAVRLLSDPRNYKENAGASQKLIEEFVHEYDARIGQKNFTFYTHLLLHIPTCVDEYGDLYSWSAYKFENYNRIMARILRRKHGHIQQFFNRVEELRYARELETISKKSDAEISKLKSYNLKANSMRDGFCMVQPGYPIAITSAFIRNGREIH